MKKFQILIWFCIGNMGITASAQGYIPTYWEVYKVFDVYGRELSDDEYKGFPLSVQTGGSVYTGFNAYVNLGGFGNDVLDMTSQRSSTGGIVYMNTLGGYLIMEIDGSIIEYGSNALGKIFQAKPLDISTYHQRMAAINRIINPYGGSVEKPNHGNSYSSGRKCSGCNGTGLCAVCKGKGWYKNEYAGSIYECFECRGNGSCQVCHGKGYISY